MKKFFKGRRGLLFVKDLSEEIAPQPLLEKLPKLEKLQIKKIEPKQDLVELEVTEKLKDRIKLTLGSSKEVLSNKSNLRGGAFFNGVKIWIKRFIIFT